jgi:hypothetical protein
VQVIQYAGRVVQLAGSCSATHIERRFVQKLALAKSNLPSTATARQIYRKVRQTGQRGSAEAGRALRHELVV